MRDCRAVCRRTASTSPSRSIRHSPASAWSRGSADPWAGRSPRSWRSRRWCSSRSSSPARDRSGEPRRAAGQLRPRGRRHHAGAVGPGGLHAGILGGAGPRPDHHRPADAGVVRRRLPVRDVRDRVLRGAVPGLVHPAGTRCCGWAQPAGCLASADRASLKMEKAGSGCFRPFLCARRTPHVRGVAAGREASRRSIRTSP